MRFKSLTLLCLMIACLFCGILADQPAAAAPETSCTLAVGMAQDAPLLDGDGLRAVMAELKFCFEDHAFGGFLELRHSFADELDHRSRFRAGLDFPLGKETVFFATFERFYRVNDSVGFAGLRFNLF